jgi:4-hydroxythreonine-4-phosphate dehydrogenase
MNRPLAISIGCPSGIGPEVAVVAASETHAPLVLVGDLGALRAAAKTRGIDPDRLVRVVGPEEWTTERGAIPVFEPIAPLAAKDRRPGHPTRAGGRAQLAWIDAATDLVRDGYAAALVTAPVSKDAIARSGAAPHFLGHTEHLAARLGAPEVTMAFANERLTTSLVTTHLPLSKVPRAITARAVARAIYWTARFVRTLGGVAPIAVAALNPHAGEAGLLGSEETSAIAPGIVLARKRLAADKIRIRIAGPIPAESAFRLAAGGAFSAVVAMYHDQATIAMKLLGFGEAVNVSLGLPIVRTSVDHGTAYDRAGKGNADARGMKEAVLLAVKLTGGEARTAARKETRKRSRT